MLTKVQNCPICKSAECQEACFVLLVKGFKCNRKQEESLDIGLAVRLRWFHKFHNFAYFVFCISTTRDKVGDQTDGRSRRNQKFGGNQKVKLDMM